eukprot:UN03267
MPCAPLLPNPFSRTTPSTSWKKVTVNEFPLSAYEGGTSCENYVSSTSKNLKKRRWRVQHPIRSPVARFFLQTIQTIIPMKPLGRSAPPSSPFSENRDKEAAVKEAWELEKQLECAAHYGLSMRGTRDSLDIPPSSTSLSDLQGFNIWLRGTEATQRHT